MSKRIIYGLMLSCALVGASQARADAYPSRPVQLVVAYSAGGPVDSAARIIAQHLGKQLGQTVVVENRAGGGGIIGLNAAAKAAPDGYTLLFAASPPHTIAPHVQAKLPYDPFKDFTPISLVADYTNVLVVNNDTPAKTVGELVSYAKKNPGQVSFGSAGIGGSNHLAGELLKTLTGAPMVHVPYKGNAPAMTDVIGGQITFMFDIIGTALSYIRGDKVRALAVTSASRNRSLPEVPTMIEAGVPGFDVTGWYGLMGPADLPKTVVDKLNQAIKAIVDDPAVAEQLRSLGYDTRPSTPEEFAARIRKEYDLWGKVVREAKIEKS